jgi:hypothetical protein
MLMRKVYQPAPAVPAKSRDERTGREMDELSKQFQGAQSKGDVMRALLVCQALFQRIVIDKAPVVSKDQAWKDFRRERVVLNGVVFIPDKVDDSRSEAFGKALRILVERMLRLEAKPAAVPAAAATAAATAAAAVAATAYSAPSSSSSSSGKGSLSSSLSSSASSPPLPPPSEASIVSDTILQRGCRTSAGADTFFLVQQLFCVDGTFVTQKTSLHAEEPIIVDVFAVPDGSGSSPAPAPSDDAAKRDQRAGGTGSRPMSASTIASTADQSQPSDASVSSGGTSGSKKKGSGGSFISHLFVEARRNRAASPPAGATRHGTVNISTVCGGATATSGGSRSRSGSELVKPASAGRSTMFARIEVKNSFAVYDEAAMDDTVPQGRTVSSTSLGRAGSGVGDAQGGLGPVPWLEVDTVLVDETNFDTMSHSRRVQVIITAVNGNPYHQQPTHAHGHGHGVGVGMVKDGTGSIRFAPHATSGGCLPNGRDNPNPGTTKKILSSAGPSN